MIRVYNVYNMYITTRVLKYYTRVLLRVYVNDGPLGIGRHEPGPGYVGHARATILPAVLPICIIYLTISSRTTARFRRSRDKSSGRREGARARRLKSSGDL